MTGLIDRAINMGWTRAHYTQAIDWFKECSWREQEMGDDMEWDDLSDAQVLMGVSRHYSGGIPQFISDSIPMRV